MSANRQIAVALRYLAEKDNAPRVVARGWGRIAEEILRVAMKAGVPIHPDPDLAEVLVRLDVDQVVPPDLYQVVAEVLAFVYRVNRGG